MLEYTFNPATQEYTDKMRLGVRLKAGLKNPKGFIEAAWAAPAHRPANGELAQTSGKLSNLQQGTSSHRQRTEFSLGTL